MVLGYCRSDSFRCAVERLVLGLGKDVSGVVGISRDEVGAGTFPDITPSLRHFASKCAVVVVGGEATSRQLRDGGGGSQQ